MFIAHITPETLKGEGGMHYSSNIDTVYNFLRHHNKRMNITVSNNHNVAVPSVYSALQEHSDLGVIWMDTIPHLNTPNFLVEGYQSVAHILRLPGTIKSSKFTWTKGLKHLRPHKIVYIGLKEEISVDEKQLLDNYNICYYTLDDINEIGIHRVMKMAINYLDTENIHLSFNNDMIDYIGHRNAEVVVRALKNHLVGADIIVSNKHRLCANAVRYATNSKL
tara:strand:- start:719 stop:1381 length:663 start_codon:yes stop_codon:yes gene_type:complete